MIGLYSMCGRFALQADAEQLADYLAKQVPELYMPRFNIAPTTPVLALTDSELTFFSWGLVPSWSKDVYIGSRMFNARAETVAEKPSFKNAYKRRRCLIPASGFYEWKVEQGGKQPYFCHLQRPIFCFGAIWEHWSDSMGNELQSCSILTQEAVGAMRAIHARMPLVIAEDLRQTWLDHSDESTDRADYCVQHCDSDFEMYAVSKKVNAARNDSADLLDPVNS
jgi:putative SOS response-associated peptidase YedK